MSCCDHVLEKNAQQRTISTVITVPNWWTWDTFHDSGGWTCVVAQCRTCLPTCWWRLCDVGARLFDGQTDNCNKQCLRFPVMPHVKLCPPNATSTSTASSIYWLVKNIVEPKQRFMDAKVAALCIHLHKIGFYFFDAIDTFICGRRTLTCSVRLPLRLWRHAVEPLTS